MHVSLAMPGVSWSWGLGVCVKPTHRCHVVCQLLRGKLPDLALGPAR